MFLVLPLACREKSAPEQRAGQVEARSQPRASAEPVRVRRLAPSGAFDCRELRPAPTAESNVVPETIELVPPRAGKTVFFSKTGERVSFDREEFLQAARCLKLEKAIRFVEEETGREQESYIGDTFQLSYVAAALLDAGRAGVRLEEESEWRKTIVRDRWSDDGCAGRCRSFGRLYRLTADDPAFFLRVSDHRRDF